MNKQKTRMSVSTIKCQAVIWKDYVLGVLEKMRTERLEAGKNQNEVYLKAVSLVRKGLFKEER